MKKRTLLLLCLPLLFASCLKDGDFSELNHPIEFQFQADPTYGLPIAQMEASIGDVIGLLGQTTAFLNIDSTTGIISFDYDTVLSQTWNFDSKSKSHKGLSKDDPADSVELLNESLQGSLPIDIFERLSDITEADFTVSGLFVNLAVDLSTQLTDANYATIDRNLTVSVSNLSLTYKSADGVTHSVPLTNEAEHLNVNQLLHGYRLTILDNQDLKDIINTRPTEFNYSLQLLAKVPADDATMDFIMTGGAQAYWKDSLKIESLTATEYISAHFPLQLYCSEITFNDTLTADLSSLDSVLDLAKDYMTLRNEGSYLVFVADNGLPIDLALNGYLMNEYDLPMGTPLFPSDSLMKAAPISATAVDGYHVAEGTTRSVIKMPLNQERLDQMAKTKKIKLNIGANTANTDGSKPTVSVRVQDKLNLRLYLLVAPHFNITYTINGEDND